MQEEKKKKESSLRCFLIANSASRKGVEVLGEKMPRKWCCREGWVEVRLAFPTRTEKVSLKHNTWGQTHACKEGHGVDRGQTLR